MLSRGSDTFTYDAENRLTSASVGGITTQYAYNADGARVKRAVDGTTTYYIGNWFEVTQAGAVTKYYYFGGKRVALRTSAGVTYLHGDHLGSTSVASTASGALVARQTCYAYGAPRTSEGTLPTDYTFTGQRADASVGLMYYGARYYDAAVGRFIQPDTIVPDWYNPQNLNRYAYTRNNPLRYKDPSGHFLVPAAIIAVGGLINLGVDWYVTTQINHQEYSLQRGAAMFAVGAITTGAAMILAPATATTAVGILGAERVAATVTSVTMAGVVTGGINVVTGAANTAVASLAEGYTPEETLYNLAQYTQSDSAGVDFAIGFVAGGSGQVLEKLLTPATQPVKTIKSVNPAPAVDVIPRGGPSPRISGFAQITANVLSDIPYLYPVAESKISGVDPFAIVGASDWIYAY